MLRFLLLKNIHLQIDLKKMTFSEGWKLKAYVVVNIQDVLTNIIINNLLWLNSLVNY